MAYLGLIVIQALDLFKHGLVFSKETKQYLYNMNKVLAQGNNNMLIVVLYDSNLKPFD